ncbi:MAG: hypothetical protein RR905_02820 [Aurantimicrobium sp.]
MSLVSIHPKNLAEMLENVMHVCQDKTAIYNEVVKLAWGGKHLCVFGRGRYAASSESREVLVEPSTGSGVWFYIHIGDCKDVAGALKKVEGAGRAGTVVTMQVIDGQLVIRDGTQDLAVLDNADPEELTESTSDSIGIWEDVVTVMGREPVRSSPLAFTRDLLKRLDKVRIGKTNQPYDVFDFAVLGGNTVGVKFGKDMTVLLEAVEREGYETGGRYGDGPGEEGALW